jgi:hypothetical protein
MSQDTSGNSRLAIRLSSKSMHESVPEQPLPTGKPLNPDCTDLCTSADTVPTNVCCSGSGKRSSNRVHTSCLRSVSDPREVLNLDNQLCE